MTQGLATTPFGRRTMSLGLIATQQQARAVETDKTVHKWKVFSALTEAKDRLGLPDRALAVLHALLSFHQETTLTAGDPLVVFPSNEKLSARAHGVAPTTLRRHLAILVDAGIIIRRDSPNGKRYARRGEGGHIGEAFGFDLTPLVARAEEFEALAAEVAAEKKALRLARERVTLARRDIGKMIALGMEEAIPGDWTGLHEAYLRIVGGLRRSSTAPSVTVIAAELADLATSIRKHLELFVNSSKPAANESQNGRHKQNSKTELPESEPAFEKIRGESRGLLVEGPGDGQTDAILAHPPVLESAMPSGTPLGMVLKACPALVEYADAGEAAPDGAPPTIRNWAMFLRTAALVRAMLGISPDAWQDAVETMGIVDASIVIAAILQKGDDIRFPGGYLRALTEKKREGHFSVGPILMALISARLKETRGHGARLSGRGEP